MSVVAEPSVNMSLLYLAVDLGARTSTFSYERQLRHVNTLWWYCAHLAAEPYELATQHTPSNRIYTITSPPDNAFNEDSIFGASLIIEKTSFGSPWISLLTTLAEKSAPVGYAVAALWSLQRLLHMIMEWQQHRLNMYLTKRYPELRSGPPGANILTQHAMREFDEQEASHGRAPYDKIEVAGPTVANAATSLSRITEVDMIDEDDPRANLNSQW